MRVAAATERIETGTGVTNPVSRDAAGSISALAEVVQQLRG